MLKLLKRTAQAERQAARRMKQRAKQAEALEKFSQRPRTRDALREVSKQDQAARRARIEDWEMGPLAPKRDLGFNSYGVTWESLRHDHPKPSPEIIERRCAWAGGSQMLNLAVGDRVLIMDGPDKGKIDKIKDIQHSQATVMLENRHKGLAGSEIFGGLQAKEFPISIGSIRLVYPLRHPKTGHIRDVVIKQLKAIPPNMKSDNMYFDRWEYGQKWDRLVPSLNVVIPWPKVEAPKVEATPSDTWRQEVEQRTFYYGLKSPPMPPSVLDELRNRYSKFRTRHEQWYIDRHEAEEAAKKAKKAKDVRSMMSPMDELYEKRQQLRQARPEPQLTDDMLEKIGRMMLRNSAAVVVGGGLPPVAEPPVSEAKVTRPPPSAKGPTVTGPPPSPPP
ncbi:hypothetical protein L249_0358 [Ophiocordyceps polyrhachis-furcata BCC 54312]|uniref:KOW domain-containing protein n=1 Tax=Ophiocordyceps polyrhachis-furcata BCC 54312 TaxID=1330021 RepID=A0A367LDM5_9HYPO|nr:hypothetical protein L249_0358 [Ophiocordyceps polyrhachis-furcata BCC 54312]